MKRFSLFTFLISFAFWTNGQKIEVTATDMVMCSIENYTYLLIVNHWGNSQSRKKESFEKILTLSNYDYKYLFEERVADK